MPIAYALNQPHFADEINVLWQSPTLSEEQYIKLQTLIEKSGGVVNTMLTSQQLYGQIKANLNPENVFEQELLKVAEKLLNVSTF